jgi:hypothetical protein
MPRFIDAEMACAEVDKGDLLVGNNADFAKEIIRRTPSADVVGVTRCKDCKKSYVCMDGKLRCCHHKGLIDEVTADDYCSYGERKE